MKPIRVMVTGAGNGVGQSIIKALRLSSLPIQLIASDISPFSTGLFRADESILMPKVELDGALDTLIALLKLSRIDLLMVGSEFELLFFARNRSIIEAETGTKVLISPLKTVEIAEDKWMTVEFLRENDLPYPVSHLPSSLEDAWAVAESWGYPVILKPRVGTSSRHVYEIHSHDQLAHLLGMVPNPLLQQMISQPSDSLHQEYTCSIFKDRGGKVHGPFTARRTLRHGRSWVVEVASFDTLRPLLLSIGEALSFVGSLNVQLMSDKKHPVPFEINARFSGTTAIRAHFGFNEPEMAIRSYLLDERLDPPVLTKGLVFSYFEEVFIDEATALNTHDFYTQGVVHNWF